jgi:hypothetical protein
MVVSYWMGSSSTPLTHPTHPAATLPDPTLPDPSSFIQFVYWCCDYYCYVQMCELSYSLLGAWDLALYRVKALNVVIKQVSLY